MAWTKVKDSYVAHYWKKKNGVFVVVNPTFYADGGTPIDEESGDDLEYDHTEVYQEAVFTPPRSSWWIWRRIGNLVVLITLMCFAARMCWTGDYYASTAISLFVIVLLDLHIIRSKLDDICSNHKRS